MRGTPLALARKGWWQWVTPVASAHLPAAVAERLKCNTHARNPYRPAVNDGSFDAYEHALQRRATKNRESKGWGTHRHLAATYRALRRPHGGKVHRTDRNQSCDCEPPPAQADGRSDNTATPRQWRSKQAPLSRSSYQAHSGGGLRGITKRSTKAFWSLHALWHRSLLQLAIYDAVCAALAIMVAGDPTAKNLLWLPICNQTQVIERGRVLDTWVARWSMKQVNTSGSMKRMLHQYEKEQPLSAIHCLVRSAQGFMVGRRHDLHARANPQQAG